MKKPYEKIKKIIYLTYLGMATSFLLSIGLILILCDLIKKNYLLIFIFFFSLFLFMIFAGFVGKKFFMKELKKHKNFIALENVSFSTDDLQKVNDELYLFAKQKKHLDTISFYIINRTIENNELKGMKSKMKSFIKQKYPITSHNSSSQSHWRINVHAIVMYYVEDEEWGKYLSVNKKMFQIGQFTLFVDINKNRIIIPFYDSNFIDIYGFFLYEKTVNYLIDMFQICNISEI